MATIIDASVMGDLQCEPNATAGEITVTTNNVTTNRDFNIDILAYNSRGSYERTLKMSKFLFAVLNDNYGSQIIILIILTGK